MKETETSATKTANFTTEDIVRALMESGKLSSDLGPCQVRITLPNIVAEAHGEVQYPIEVVWEI